jgi:hypothetical protein
MDPADMVRSVGLEVVEAAKSDDAIEILEVRRDIMVVLRPLDAGARRTG